jgi:hypothetical protein
MGRDIDLARVLGDSPAHVDLMETLKEELLIVLLKRLGGAVVIPCPEMDNTADDNLAMRMDPETREFHFSVVSTPEGI